VLRITIAGVILPSFSVEARVRHTCKHRDNSTWLLNASKRRRVHKHVGFNINSYEHPDSQKDKACAYVQN